jgi:flavin reductase (DIM6/NTAB) family NADH-FMN oxidoreductase RutF
MISRYKFYLLLHPRPAYVIGSGKWGEKINFMAASWVTPVAEEPPTVGVAIDNETYTYELVSYYKEFTINILPINMVDKIYRVGRMSGREIDKTQILEANKGYSVSAPIVKDSLGTIECKVIGEYETKDVTFYFGKVLHIQADKNYFDEKIGWRIEKKIIPLHNWGKGFYKLGEFMLVR